MIHARAHLRLAANGARWWLLVSAHRLIDRAVYAWLQKNKERS